MSVIHLKRHRLAASTAPDDPNWSGRTMNKLLGYAAAHEAGMRLYSRTLDEDHRRRNAAIEGLKIGFGDTRSRSIPSQR